MVRFSIRQSYLIALLIFSVNSSAAENRPYDQTRDHVIADVAGIGLTMDIFEPIANANGLGVVVVASGGWNSNREMLDIMEQAASLFSILTAHGYTTFVIRPGSKDKFTASEMLENVNTAIAYVKANDFQYGIDPNKLALLGWSAGGHLAALSATTARPEEQVAAVALFFPPTNFLDWGEEGELYEDLDSLIPAGLTEDEVIDFARRLSPSYNISASAPRFLIWHGDEDPIVPLQQSEDFVRRLTTAGVHAELNIKQGGRHAWRGISEQAEHIAAWFDEILLP